MKFRSENLLENGNKHRHARRARVIFFCELEGIKSMICKMSY